jgi:hemerythrin superfamily protein
MKVTVYLMRNHATLRSLFERFKMLANRTGKDRKNLFDEIHREVTLHSQMEREIFYPALQNSPSVRSAGLIDAALADHQRVERLLEGLQKTNGSHKIFQEGMSQLIEDVTAQIDREEDEMFDEARKSLPEFRLEELGLEMEDRRRILTLLAA